LTVIIIIITIIIINITIIIIIIIIKIYIYMSSQRLCQMRPWPSEQAAVERWQVRTGGRRWGNRGKTCTVMEMVALWYLMGL